jgi:hypothetical protein
MCISSFKLKFKSLELRVKGLGGFAMREIAGKTYPSHWSNLVVGCDAAQEERWSRKELVFV